MRRTSDTGQRAVAAAAVIIIRTVIATALQHSGTGRSDTAAVAYGCTKHIHCGGGGDSSSIPNLGQQVDQILAEMHNFKNADSTLSVLYTMSSRAPCAQHCSAKLRLCGVGKRLQREQWWLQPGVLGGWGQT